MLLKKRGPIPFEEYIERSNGHLDWDIARPLFMPVISALEALHVSVVSVIMR